MSRLNSTVGGSGSAALGLVVIHATATQPSAATRSMLDSVWVVAIRMVISCGFDELVARLEHTITGRSSGRLDCKGAERSCKHLGLGRSASAGGFPALVLRVRFRLVGNRSFAWLS